MKKIAIILVLVAGLFSMTQAQKYFVYDGATFSIMFTCDSGNKDVEDLQFSSKDKKTGEWKWNKFSVYDYADFDDTSVGGFIFYCKDGVNNKYAIDYYRDSDYVLVHFVKTDGSYGTQWKLTRRNE